MTQFRVKGIIKVSFIVEADDKESAHDIGEAVLANSPIDFYEDAENPDVVGEEVTSVEAEK